MSGVPICRDCAHLVGKRTYIEDATNWKCGHPSNVKASSVNPVTGVTRYTYRYANCYDTRRVYVEKKIDENIKALSCGPQGLWFQPYEQPQAPAGKPARSLPSADSLLGELGL